MGFTLSSEQITIHKVQGDGLAPFWWLAVSGGVAYAGDYDTTTRMTRSANPIYAASNFRDLVSQLMADNIGIPQRPMSLNVDIVVQRAGLGAEFESPFFPDAQVIQMFTTYDPEALVITFGLAPLLPRASQLSLITYDQIRESILAMGLESKIDRARAEQVLDSCVSVGGINADQKTNILTSWDLTV